MTLFVGFTSHCTKAVPGFTLKYNITPLVWFEIYDGPISAIPREKEPKKMETRSEGAVDQGQNPDWNDLYESIPSSVIRDGPSAPDWNLGIPGSRL
jgi:predicted GIY-YIG superfamily endonuclease